MPNSIATSIAQNKETFKNFRLYLIQNSFTKEQVLKLEESSNEIYIPRCIKFIEANNINFNEAINYYVWERPDIAYWELLITTIVGVFRKIENNDINFDIY